MKYEDETIVRLRNCQKKKKYKDSSTGMYVGETLLNFREILLFQSYCVMIPEPFGIMEQELAQKKYPSIKRPQFILSDEKGMVNFSFNLYDKKIEPGTPEGVLGQFKIIIQAAYPGVQFMGDGCLDGNKYHSCWFGFCSNSLDGGVFNLLSLTDLREQFILGMFNCSENDWILWKPLMLEVLSTIDTKEVKE